MSDAPLILTDPVRPGRVQKAVPTGRGFWALVAAMVVATLGLTTWGALDGRFETQRRVIPFAEIAALVDEAAARAETATVAQVDAELDAIFAPVEAAIPAYADFHYSVLGEYTQLAQLATGQVGAALEERLFGGFQERLDGALGTLEGTFAATYASALEADMAEVLGNAEIRFLTEGTRIALADAQARASATKPISLVLGVAGATAGRQAVKVVTAAVARKLLLSIGRKTAAKTATRGTGAGGAAGVGAAAGAVFGPVGAAIGGAGGFIVGWVTTDYVVIKLDELMNRDEFETELRAMIAEERAALRTVLIAQVAAKRDEITLAGRTPDAVLRGE
jgi:hypothetical protein